ncbi:hypothetical protein V8E36_005977 [Tilletia maclaganii]
MTWAAAAEEILTALGSIPVGLALLGRFTPLATSSSFYYTQLHRLQSVLTLFVHLLLATSNLSLEHALYLKLSLKPAQHARSVHSLVVVTSVPRGGLKVQQAVLAFSLLATAAAAWVSRQPTSTPAHLARAILAHASLVLSAAMTLLTLPLDGPSLQVHYTLAGLDAIYQQAPETTGAFHASEREEFAPIELIWPFLPERRPDGTLGPRSQAAMSSSIAAKPAPRSRRRAAADPAGATTAEEAQMLAQAEQDEPDAEGWVKVAETNKKQDVYVRRTVQGTPGRGWELETRLGEGHPLREMQRHQAEAELAQQQQQDRAQ